MRYHAWIRMSMCAERRREQILNNMSNNCLCVFVVVYVVLALQEVHASININSLSFLLTATYVLLLCTDKLSTPTANVVMDSKLRIDVLQYSKCPIYLWLSWC